MRKLTATLGLHRAVLFGIIGMRKGANFHRVWDAFQAIDFAFALRFWKPVAKF